MRTRTDALGGVFGAGEGGIFGAGEGVVGLSKRRCDFRAMTTT